MTFDERAWHEIADLAGYGKNIRECYAMITGGIAQGYAGVVIQISVSAGKISVQFPERDKKYQTLLPPTFLNVKFEDAKMLTREEYEAHIVLTE